MDIRQSSNWAKYLEKLGWKIIKFSNGQAYTKKLLFFGSIIKIPRIEKVNFSQVDKLAKENNAILIKLEPTTHHSLLTTQFSADSWPLSPSKTLQLDLKNIEPKSDVKYEIRKAEKNKVVVKTSDDIESFIKLWHKNAKKRGFWVPFYKEIRSIFEAFDKDASLLLAYKDNLPIAGALILFSGKTAHYMHAASSEIGRKTSAQYLVVWSALQLAKKRGAKIFDFEGIFDPRYRKQTKKWVGFTNFKKSFGGNAIEYPGSFSKFYGIGKILKPFLN
ncbi:MAG TPA: peptidoglycan bridge formation glycyltransferase FemA/FemB family protein [Patescibacteria group bacterium]